MKKFVNLLTLIRILATFALPFVWNGATPIVVVAFVLFTLLTDFFDGKLARIFKVQTLFGSIADTIADKFFGIIIIVVIAQDYPVFYALVLMEIIIAIINVVAALLGATTKSSFLGKSKMWIISISIMLALLTMFSESIIKIPELKELIQFIINNKEDVLNTWVSLSVGSEIIVAIDYFRHTSKEIIDKKQKVKYKFKSKEELKEVLFDTKYYLKHKNEPLSKLLLKN